MSEDLGAALAYIAAFSMFGRMRNRAPRNPEEAREQALKEAERIAAKEQAKLEADYTQAYALDDEFNRSPRAFRRRYNQTISKGGQS